MLFLQVFLLLFALLHNKPIRLWKLKASNFEKAREQYPVVILFRAAEPEDMEADEELQTEFNRSLTGLDEYGVNAAVINCETAPKICKNLGIREDSILKYFSKSSPLDYTGKVNASDIHDWIISQQLKSFRVFKTYEDAEPIIKQFAGIFVGYFDSRKSIEFEVFEQMASSPKPNVPFVAIINQKLDKTKIEYLRPKDNWKEKYSGHWTWTSASSWVSDVQMPWSEELGSENAERYRRQEKPVLYLFYDKRQTLPEELAEQALILKERDDVYRERRIKYPIEIKYHDDADMSYNHSTLYTNTVCQDDTSEFDAESAAISTAYAQFDASDTHTLSSSSPTSSSPPPPPDFPVHTGRFAAVDVAARLGRKYRGQLLVVTASYRRWWRWARMLGLSNAGIPGAVLSVPFDEGDPERRIHYPLWVEREAARKAAGTTGGVEVVEEWEDQTSTLDFDVLSEFIDAFLRNELPIRLRTAAHTHKYGFTLDFTPAYAPYSYANGGKTANITAETNASLSSSTDADPPLPTQAAIEANSAVRAISGAEFNGSCLMSGVDTVAFVHAPWCLRCPRAAAAFEQVAYEEREAHTANATQTHRGTEEEHTTPLRPLSFVSLDANDNDMWPSFSFDSLPTVFVFPHRQPLAASVCTTCHTAESLREFLHSHTHAAATQPRETLVAAEEKHAKHHNKFIKAIGLEDVRQKRKLLFEDET